LYRDENERLRPGAAFLFLKVGGSFGRIIIALSLVDGKTNTEKLDDMRDVRNIFVIQHA
jgi:hypothetical protein